MQQDDAKQKSKFKWVKGIAAAILVPGLGVPVTKLVESHYDVSVFSPAMAGLWSLMRGVGDWLNLTAPIYVWEFLVVTVSAGVLGAFGVGTLLYSRLEIRAAKAEQDKAFAKAREVIARLKTVSAELDDAKLELNATRKSLEATDLELKATYVKISELKAPESPPLTKDQDNVIAAIAAYDNEGENCSTRDFPAHIGLTLLEADGAMDVLEAMKLIAFEYYNGQRYVTLTAKGRAYVLRPDFVMLSLFQRGKR
ncbi:hypothetical protein KJF94_12910 [Pseudomonas hormoni]|uniref:Uncharacterized protein n=1 Tax=Pseudomonas hormoni TaxID=3093767 RepID=A0ABX8F5F6_9PSED|nr:hypothetical protein [Pseudomonas hormoni]QVW26374.1 hypothetical protein KJF94_12910 [Pseudomonas hormoni]